MVDDGWPSEWLRALLPPCVLGIVAADETYGYAIAQRLQVTATPDGRAHLAERTAAWSTFTEQAAALLPAPSDSRRAR